MDFAANGPKWKYSLVGIDQPPALDAAFVDDFAVPAELQPGGVAATLEELAWDASPGNLALQWTVTGSHWFHVKKEKCTGSCVPSGVSPDTLQKLASHYWAGEAGKYAAAGPVAEIPNILNWWSPPPPDCTICDALDVLAFAHINPGHQLVMRTPAGDYSIESQLTPAAADALKTTTDVEWLAPSEPTRLPFGVSIRFASVSKDGSRAGPAFKSTPQGIDKVGSICVHCSPPQRSRFGAVLRATRGDLVVVGGVLEGGGYAGDIWRYDIEAASWTKVDTQGQVVPAAVLATAYDGDAHRLYVLDEVGALPSSQARFWSLDFVGGVMHVMGTWPRTGYFDQFELGHSHDGSLILLASHGQGVPLKVLRLVVAGDSVTIDRVRTTTGVPVAPPRTNQRGIHIIVDRPGKQIVGDRLDWSSLNSPGGQTLADFVK